eukprot:jgi/Ulvmu1/3322/UM155_0005.1
MVKSSKTLVTLSDCLSPVNMRLSTSRSCYFRCWPLAPAVGHRIPAVTSSCIYMSVLLCLIDNIAALASSESTTSIFVDRVSQCQSADDPSSFIRECAHTYTIGIGNAIRLLSTAPIKTTEDAIAAACVSGCVHAVSSQLADSMRDDTPCAQSVKADVGPLLLPLGLSLCAEGTGFTNVEFVDGSNLCYTQLTQVMDSHGMLADLVDVDGHFQWPVSPFQMITFCQSLQRTGCCATTYQRVLTAYFMASCHIPEALQMGRLLSMCAAHDVPLSTDLCKMPGVDNSSAWLVEYDPYADGVLATRQLRCAELSATAVDSAVAADRRSECWSNPCALMHSLSEVARNLGIQSAEALTYLVMLSGSFGVLCMCIWLSCIVSWGFHRMDVGARKAFLPSRDTSRASPSYL